VAYRVTDNTVCAAVADFHLASTPISRWADGQPVNIRTNNIATSVDNNRVSPTWQLFLTGVDNYPAATHFQQVPLGGTGSSSTDEEA
jgi:hypothetical protein